MMPTKLSPMRRRATSPQLIKKKLDAAVKAIEDAEAAKKKEDQAAADVVKKMIDDLPAVADVKPENKTSVDERIVLLTIRIITDKNILEQLLHRT